MISSSPTLLLASYNPLIPSPSHPLVMSSSATPAFIGDCFDRGMRPSISMKNADGVGHPVQPPPPAETVEGKRRGCGVHGRPPEIGGVSLDTLSSPLHMFDGIVDLPRSITDGHRSLCTRRPSTSATHPSTDNRDQKISPGISPTAAVKSARKSVRRRQ